MKPKFVALDYGVFTVSILVTDASGLSSVATSTATVKNSPPVITSFILPSNVRVGTMVNTRATLKKAGVYDTLTATWNWRDGTATSRSISN
jgi:hypothetical protein